MAKKIDFASAAQAAKAALASYISGSEPGSAQLALAVRGLLQAVAERYPGRSVELRVPPFGAIQCVPGPGHSRGTPPNVVELEARSFLELAAGVSSWQQLDAAGKLRASGARSDLSGLFPILR